MEQDIIRTGGCECGATQYSIRAPIHVYACHCLNCQTRSGSAFAEHAIIAAAQFDAPAESVAYRRQVDGIDFEEVFCARCFTRLYNHNSALPDMIFLRAGTLADSGGLQPIAHIWTDRAQDWIAIPADSARFPKSPTPEEFAEVIRRAEAGGAAAGS